MGGRDRAIIGNNFLTIVLTFVTKSRKIWTIDKIFTKRGEVLALRRILSGRKYLLAQAIP